MYRHHHPKRVKKSILVPGRENSFFLSLSLCLGPCFVERCELPLRLDASAAQLGGWRTQWRTMTSLEQLQHWRRERERGKQFVVTQSFACVLCVVPPFGVCVCVCFVCFRECVVQLLAFPLLFVCLFGSFLSLPWLPPRFTLQIIHTLYINISFLFCSFFLVCMCVFSAVSHTYFFFFLIRCRRPVLVTCAAVAFRAYTHLARGVWRCLIVCFQGTCFSQHTALTNEKNATRCSSSPSP